MDDQIQHQQQVPQLKRETDLKVNERIKVNFPSLDTVAQHQRNPQDALGGRGGGGHSNVPALHLGLQCTLKALTRPLNFFPLHWKAAALFQKSKLVNTRTPFPEPREFPPIPFQTPPDSKKAEGGHALGEERGLRPRVAGEVTPRSRDAEGAACGWGTGR